MKHCIYKITNTVNDKIYVGKHSTENLDDGYMGSGKLIKRAIEKYGIDKFNKEIVFEFETEEEALLMESEIVDDMFIARLDTYNIIKGGLGGWSYVNENVDRSYLKSDENLKRLREMSSIGCEAMKLRWNDSEFSEECKLKISNAVKLYWETNGHNWVGRKHNEESKNKIGKANSIHQQGKGNSVYGTCWIHNLKLKESKLIKKDDLQSYLDKGWVKGRKMKF
jgi:hypothetical protein